MYGQQYGYSPGAVPNQQARLAALQQYQMQQQMAQPMPYPQPMMPQPIPQPMQVPMQGRMVASIEEAKVAQVPVDGSCIYFPCPSEHKIFVKSMDLNGNAVFETYSLVSDTEAKPCYAEVSALEALQTRVLELENRLKGASENV